MYFVTGAGGFLGSYVLRQIIDKTDETVFAQVRTRRACAEDNGRVRLLCCDIRELAENLPPELKDGDGVKCIHLCACHNIDTVAREPDVAYSINVTATEKLLRAWRPACLFFASTDAVYGEGGDYRFRETDEKKPLSLYGRQKLAGEEAVLSRGYNVARLPYMFSPSVSPRKKHFCDEIISKLQAGERVKLFTNSVRSTLSFETVADILIRLCEQAQEGESLSPVYNIAGDEALSKYETGLRLAREKGLDESLIEACRSDGVYIDGAQRAYSTLMDNRLVKQQLGSSEIKWRL